MYTLLSYIPFYTDENATTTTQSAINSELLLLRKKERNKKLILTNFYNEGNVIFLKWFSFPRRKNCIMGKHIS